MLYQPKHEASADHYLDKLAHHHGLLQLGQKEAAADCCGECKSEARQEREMTPGEPGYLFQLSSLFFGTIVMFLLDVLAPMGLVAAGGVMQTVGVFFLFMGLRKNYLFWASKGHFS